MTFDDPVLERRIRRMLGDAHAAEDVCQEAYLRAWRDGQGRAWTYRTATNLALDELRRRRVRAAVPLEEALDAGAAADPDTGPHTRAALARLSAHERFLLLLRFQAGLRHGEIAALLGIGEPAARQRLARARRAFAAAVRETAPRRPRVALLVADGAPDTCEDWLAAAGAEVIRLDPDAAGLTLAGADALVLTGSVLDIDPRLYGEAPGPLTARTDLAADRRDLELIRQALVDDLPIVGVCRGAQMLNLALGGSLWQDIGSSAVAHPSADPHPIRTGENSPLRTIIGRRADVGGPHHQAVRRLGRGVRPIAVSADGLVEAIDVSSRRFALGVQWHPEAEQSPVAGPLLGEALVAHAGRG